LCERRRISARHTALEPQLCFRYCKLLAGITVFGTSAAGDFLTNKNKMKKLAAVAPSVWEKKNMELVLSTDVIAVQPTACYLSKRT
jgi:hypothetical protein